MVVFNICFLPLCDTDSYIVIINIKKLARLYNVAYTSWQLYLLFYICQYYFNGNIIMKIIGALVLAISAIMLMLVIITFFQDYES
jgi:hypothetical protein